MYLGEDMVRRRREQRSLFGMVLPDGDKLWPEDLRRIDEALDDDELVETIGRCSGETLAEQ